MFISFVCWIAIGAVVGLISGKFVNPGDDDPRLGVLVAAIAAAIAGLLYRILATSPANWPGIWGLLIAAGAALLAVAGWHISRSASRA